MAIRIVRGMPDAETIPLSAPDGYTLACRRWLPPEGTTVRGIVVYLHGIQSHGGWYGASAARLADAGLAVYLPDRRGSGANTADRGHCDSWEQLVADVTGVEDYALADARASTAGERLPLFLLAVSWGGKLAAALAAMHDGRYAGLALLCPGLCPKRDVSARDKARIALALIRGKGGEEFPIPLSDPALFTATPRWLKFLRDDPLALHRATARFLFESRCLDAEVRVAPPWIHVPVYLALAGNDAIIDNAATGRWFERVASTDKTLKTYAGAHHTLEFEPDPAPVFNDLAAWLVERAERSTLSRGAKEQPS